MGNHIFVSYSHKDTSYARRLADSLTDKGFDVWIDDRIDYGSQWPRVIEKNLDTCAAFVIVISPNAKASTWVQNELSRAGRKNKPIYPVLLNGDEMWLELESTQYVDVRDKSLPDTKFYKLLAKHAPRQRQAHNIALETPATKSDAQPVSQQPLSGIKKPDGSPSRFPSAALAGSQQPSSDSSAELDEPDIFVIVVGGLMGAVIGAVCGALTGGVLGAVGWWGLIGVAAALVLMAFFEAEVLYTLFESIFIYAVVGAPLGAVAGYIYNVVTESNNAEELVIYGTLGGAVLFGLAGLTTDPIFPRFEPGVNIFMIVFPLAAMLGSVYFLGQLQSPQDMFDGFIDGLTNIYAIVAVGLGGALLGAVFGEDL